MPHDLHGGAAVKDLLRIDRLRKTCKDIKRWGVGVVPTSYTFNSYDSTKRIMLHCSDKLVGEYTLGLFALGATENAISGRRGYLSAHISNKYLYWYIDYTAIGLDGTETKEVADATLQAWLQTLTAEQRMYTYVRETPIETNITLTPVVSSTAPELPVEAIEVTGPSCDYPAVITPTEGSVTVEGKNLFDCVPEPEIVISSYLGRNYYKKFPKGAQLTLSIRFKHGKSADDIPTGSYLGLVGREAVTGTNQLVANNGWLVYRGTLQAYFCSADTAYADNPGNFTGWGLCVYPTNIASWNTLMDVFNVQLEYGDTATEFTPYFPGASAELPPMHGLSQSDTATDYDYIDRKNKKVLSDYIVKTREEVNGEFVDKVYKTEKYEVFDCTNLSSVTVSKNNSGIYYSVFWDHAKHVAAGGREPAYNNLYSPALCSHFTQSTQRHTSRTIECFSGHPDSSAAFILTLDESRGVTDSASALAFFSAQSAAGTPVQILYELAEPVTTDITDTDEGQAILQLRTIPYHTRVYGDYHMEAHMRTWEGGDGG